MSIYEQADGFEQTLLRLCNAARTDVGARPLRRDQRLDDVARLHAQAMARGAYLDHVDVQGRGVGERLQDAGFIYRWAGENISAGKNRADDVFAWWMTSAGHRDNILKPEFELMGAGYCHIERDVRSFHHYWCLVLAAEM